MGSVVSPVTTSLHNRLTSLNLRFVCFFTCPGVSAVSVCPPISRIVRILLQVFVASALMEWHYDNSSAKVPNNIWEMGAKRFMAQPGFALAYIEYQLGLGDTANARATFERALTVTPLEEAQPLWDGYLKFEVQVSILAWPITL